MATAILAVFSLALSAPAGADPQPSSDRPAQGYVLDDGQFRRVAVPGATDTGTFGINTASEDPPTMVDRMAA